MGKTKYDKDPVLFAVGSPERRLSAIYRLWVQGDEVYFGSRDSLNALKVSLHKSNDWRIAFVKRLKDKDRNSDRIILRWQRTPDYAPGYCQCINVYISQIRPITPFNFPKIEDSRVIWIRPSAAHQQLVLVIGIASPQADTDPIRFVPDLLVARRKKRNGETVLVLSSLRARNNVLTNGILKIYKDLEENSIRMAQSANIADSRIFSITSNKSQHRMIDANNPPTIVDIELGKEHINVTS
jgi:hypothetical protein